MANKKNTKKQTRYPFIVALLLTFLIAIGIASFFLVLRFAYPDKFEKIFKVKIKKPPFQGEKPNPSDSNNPTPDVPEHGEGTLTATFINVGQGDSMLLKLPDGKTMLVDGGNTGKDKNIIPLLNALNVKRLDYVLLTHTDSDHCGGLDKVVDAYSGKVGEVFLPKIKEKKGLLNDLGEEYGSVDSTAYSDFVKSAKNSGAVLKYMLDKMTISGSHYTVDLYCRNEAFYKLKKTSDSLWLNDVSPIGVVSYNGRKIIFTGDANGNKSIEGNTNKYSAEHNWVETMKSSGVSDNDFDADVYKAGHHGSKGSSSEELLEYIDCEYAVVSSGCGTELKGKSTTYKPFVSEELLEKGLNLLNFFSESKYGHPTEDICGLNGRLKKANFKAIYYTCLHGNIFVSIDKNGNLLFSTENSAVPSDTAIIFKPNTEHDNSKFTIVSKFSFVISYKEIEKYFNCYTCVYF